MLGRDRIAEPEHDVVDLDDRVLAGRIAEAAPGRRIAPALRARAADRAVAPRVVEPGAVELEQELRHAAVDLRAEARGDDRIGDASAHHVGAPGPVGIVAVVLAEGGAGGGLAAVEELDPEVVLALAAVLDDAPAALAVGRRERDPRAVDHHPPQPGRQIAELEHEDVVLVVVPVAVCIDEVAGRGGAAEDDRRGRVLAEADARAHALARQLLPWHQHPADGREGDADRDLGERLHREAREGGAGQRRRDRGAYARDGGADGSSNGRHVRP